MTLLYKSQHFDCWCLELFVIHWQPWDFWTHCVSLCLSLSHISFTLPISTLYPLIPMSFPLVNLLLSRFSDKKLERGKWNFALIYFLSFFLSLFLSSLSLLALNHLTSLFLAVNLICISFHTQGPSEIKLYSHSLTVIVVSSFIFVLECLITDLL